MLVQRELSPEKLDALPADHPEAVASRRDLRIIDRIMGNSRWLARQLRNSPLAPGRCVEFGAGGGTLARRLLSTPGLTRYTAIDLAPRPADLPSGIDWIEGDLLDNRDLDYADTLLASLILHHFDAEDLARLGAKIERAGIGAIFAAEPRRQSRFQALAQAGRWIGFNDVTLHDASVSVAAGFRGRELPQALGLDARRWTIHIDETVFGAYRLAAIRP